VAEKTYRRLYRSESNRMIAGVCGGIGEILRVDPTIVRIACAFLGLFSVGGILTLGLPAILLYVVCWIVVPTESEVS